MTTGKWYKTLPLPILAHGTYDFITFTVPGLGALLVIMIVVLVYAYVRYRLLKLERAYPDEVNIHNMVNIHGMVGQGLVLPPLPGMPGSGPSMASAFVTAPTPMQPPSAAPVVPEGPPIVLVADDSAVVRTKLKRLLEGAGFTVVHVNDGNEALAQLEEKPEIAVLITDLEMPNKDGFELIADVHGSLVTEDLPVIAITGHDELHGRVGQIEGVYGIFKKPWNDRELLKRVESLAHLRRSASRRGRRATDLRAPPSA